MRVAMGREPGRLVSAAVMALALGCGTNSGGPNPPDTVVWISFFNNTSSVDVVVHIVSAYATDTIPILAGGTTGTNLPFGEAGDFLSFQVTAPGASDNVDCEVSPEIIVQEFGPPPTLKGEINIVANGVTTDVTCGNNWQ